MAEMCAYNFYVKLNIILNFETNFVMNLPFVQYSVLDTVSLFNFPRNLILPTPLMK